MTMPPSFGPDRSSTGMDAKIAAMLCYFGSFVTGFLFLVFEKQSRFVKFHAMQSIIVSASLIVIHLILGMIPLIGWFAAALLVPLSFILWLALMLLALQGKWFKLPIIGDFAEQQAYKY
jgi:Predicted membrane protein